MAAGWARLRLTDLLGAAGVFSGRAPVPRVAVPPDALPDDVAATLAGLPEPVRRGVLDPLGRADPPGRVGDPVPLLLPSLTGRTTRARQVDETTCGSAVLAVLALAGDPRLAVRLARATDPAAAFAALQHSVKRATVRTRGDVPAWPASLGTPPWGAARVARYGAVRFTHRVVPDLPRSGSGRVSVWSGILDAVRAGIPVPLYTGGDLGRGLGTAVPRHVVLLVSVGRPDGGGEELARVYEPASGMLHAVPFGALRAPDASDGGHADDAPARAARLAALGGWPHVTWALLPSGPS